MNPKWVLPTFIVIFSLPLIGAAGASDAEFSRALNAAGCLPERVTVTQNELGTQIYEVICLGNPPRFLSVFCTKSTCSVASGRDGGNSENSKR
jgi:hypothetical protein